MKINKSIEQGIFVVIMLELEKDHKPLKCPTLSENLGVSTTYLQKILHRMVNAGIVHSNASKDGGYTIAKPASRSRSQTLWTRWMRRSSILILSV
jgi:Rrf2 family iron-sulfur cluster assembly transcriptional regulator